MIYLDYAATTPMSKNAISVYGEVAQKYFGNPSSLHDYGSTAQQILDRTRKTIGTMLNGPARGIYFTGGGSDANERAIRSLAAAHTAKGKHLLTTRAEHSSVRNTFALLEQQGFEVEYIPLDQSGRVRLDVLEELIREDTLLASIHHGNPEIGTIQDLEAIGRVLNRGKVLFHSDCVQTFGKIPIDLQSAGLDSISISAHKIYGPKGVGAAFIDPSCSWSPVMPGTTHEKGFRPGTVNVPGVAAFMAAAEDSEADREQEQKREWELRQRFLHRMSELEFPIKVEGSEAIGETLAHVIGFRIPGMEGQYAMIECNRHGLSISTGSACSVGSEKPAASMTALGRNEQQSREFVRVSLGKQTTKQEIDDAAEIIKKVLTNHFSMVKL